MIGVWWKACTELSTRSERRMGPRQQSDVQRLQRGSAPLIDDESANTEQKRSQGFDPHIQGLGRILANHLQADAEFALSREVHVEPHRLWMWRRRKERGKLDGIHFGHTKGVVSGERILVEDFKGRRCFVQVALNQVGQIKGLFPLRIELRKQIRPGMGSYAGRWPCLTTAKGARRPVAADVCGELPARHSEQYIWRTESSIAFVWISFRPIFPYTYGSERDCMSALIRSSAL